MGTTTHRQHAAGHAAPVRSVAFRADGRRLASCSADGTVVVWDTAEPDRPVQVTALRHRGSANAAAWNPAAADLLATASGDGTAALWRIVDDRPPHRMAVLGGHTGGVTAVDWMPDGQHLLCLSGDGRASMWNALAGGYVGEVAAHGHCRLVAISAAGLIATTGSDGLIAVRDPWSRDTATTRAYPMPIEACAWSPAGDLLAVARDDGVVDLLTSELARTRRIRIASSGVRCLAWAPDGGRLVAGTYAGAVRVVDLEHGTLRRMGAGRLWPRSVSTVGGLIAVGSFGDQPTLIDLETGVEVAATPAAADIATALCTTGDELVIGCRSGLVLAVEPAAAAEPTVRVVTEAAGAVLSLAAADGAVYVGTSTGQVLRCRDGGEVAATVGAPVTALCVSPDGLVAAAAAGAVLALDPVTLELAERAEPHHAPVRALAQFRTGILGLTAERTVVVGHRHRRSTLWEHGNRVTAVASSGDVIASASRGLNIHVTRLSTTGPHVDRRQSLPGPREPVKALSLLGDASAPVVLAGSYDSVIYAWRLDWTGGASVPTAGWPVAQLQQELSCMVRLGERRAAVAGGDGDIVLLGLTAAGDIRAEGTLRLGELVVRAGRPESPAV